MNGFSQYESNPKEMWKKMSDLTNKKTKSTNIPEIKEDGDMLTDPTEVWNSFNNFFSEIDLSDKLPEPDYLPESYVNPINSEFYFQAITETEVFKLLATLKTSKATGHDRISAKLLKDSADVIAKTLTKIFNKSVLLGKFPDDMNVAIISPVHIKLEVKRRPRTIDHAVSVLFVVAKIFEKIISQQISNYLETNGVIVNQQFGFGKKHSTQTALLNVTKKWYLIKYG